MEKIHGLLGMRGGVKDRALIILQHGQPIRDIGGVVLAHLRCDTEIRAEERACELCYEFFAGIAFVAPGFTAEAAVETGRMPRPVG